VLGLTFPPAIVVAAVVVVVICFKSFIIADDLSSAYTHEKFYLNNKKIKIKTSHKIKIYFRLPQRIRLILPINARPIEN
jgi:hypothetical protein